VNKVEVAAQRKEVIKAASSPMFVVKKSVMK
jgi:hypothetical protein